LSKLLDDTNSTDDKKNKNNFEWKYVLVRWYDAWVWSWKLIDWTHWNIILEDARMLWRWWTKKGVWLSSLAVNWLDESKSEIKILDTQEKILINDLRVSTFFVCTKEVEEQIRNYKTAEQN
jgi:hypothetical protein